MRRTSVALGSWVTGGCPTCTATGQAASQRHRRPKGDRADRQEGQRRQWRAGRAPDRLQPQPEHPRGREVVRYTKVEAVVEIGAARAELGERSTCPGRVEPRRAKRGDRLPGSVRRARQTQLAAYLDRPGAYRRYARTIVGFPATRGTPSSSTGKLPPVSPDSESSIGATAGRVPGRWRHGPTGRRCG